DAVASVALAKQEDGSSHGPKLEAPPVTVALSLDGTCTLRGADGWREALVGTIGFYDHPGERLHTIDLAATPEYGQATFLGRLEAEVTEAKRRYPAAHSVGIADGAQGNWEFLEQHTEVQVVDFWHAAEDLGQAAAVLDRGQPATRRSWIEASCRTLTHDAEG